METLTPINPIQQHWTWTNKEMNYSSMLTPPSSSEDSPQPVYFVASPNSNNFRITDDYGNATEVYQPGLVTLNNDNSMDTMQNQPYLTIMEQPTDKFRFRYKSEMAGTHGSLNGVNSDKTRKQTYPTVELKNFDQPAIIRCSIYQSNSMDKEMMPHAHRLIKKYGKDEVDDPHSMRVSKDEGYVATFHSMGIIHTAKKNIVTELLKKKTTLKKEAVARKEMKARELTKKEEMELKQEAESESKTINLNIVCLRFDAMVELKGILYPICSPVYSHGINNLKSALTGELKIVRMDHCTSPSKGNREIFILVERVTKKNIRVRFFELDEEDREIWEDFGKFSDLDVHHQYAIVFKTPKYRDVNITSKVKVYIELVRPSDNARSEPKEFTYFPSDDMYLPGSKRSRPSEYSGSYDSSNIGSDELPIPINYINNEGQVHNSWGMDRPLNSEEMRRAMGDVDSDEFNKICEQFLPEYQTWASQEVAMDGFRPSKAVSANIAPIIVPINVDPKDKAKAVKDYEQLDAFFKTRPSVERTVNMLKKLFGQPNSTNALHVFISLNDWDKVNMILKCILVSKEFGLVNTSDNNAETPLHLAVKTNNTSLVKSLIDLKADITLTNSSCNTPLHLACKLDSLSKIMELLIIKNAEYLDATNNEGDCALFMALEKKNMFAIKLLLMRGANVNIEHNKNGYTPLRYAIDANHLEAVRYILSHDKLEPLQKDFSGISALQAAYSNTCSKEIVDIVTEYMKRNDIQLEIKEEIEYESSDDEMEVDPDEMKIVIKSEPLSNELEIMYGKIKKFTPEALNEISKILDQSGNFSHLADLLELGHLVRSGIYRDSISKNLLTYAVEVNNDSLLIIRNFLADLDEHAIVSILDNMVITCYNKL